MWPARPPSATDVCSTTTKPELTELQKIVAQRLGSLLKRTNDPAGRAILTKLVAGTVNNRLGRPRIPTLVGQLRQIDPMSRASGKRLSALIRHCRRRVHRWRLPRPTGQPALRTSTRWPKLPPPLPPSAN
ncbi:MAG: hypothetical protein ACI9OJ_005115 [Myxococcota bacterium]|jgi:hypothetical protein